MQEKKQRKGEKTGNIHSHHFCILFFCFIFALSFFNGNVYATKESDSNAFEPIIWTDDIKKAMIEAYESDKDVLLYIEDANPASIDFHRKILNKKAFQRYIREKYIPVYINLGSWKNRTKEKQAEIAQIRAQYYIEKIPSVTTINSDDVLLAQISTMPESVSLCIKSLDSQKENTLRFISLLEEAFKQPGYKTVDAVDKIISENMSPIHAAKYYPKLVHKVVQMDPMDLYGMVRKYKVPLDAMELINIIRQVKPDAPFAVSQLNRFIKENKPDKETLVEILCFKIQYIVENKGNNSIAAKTYFQVQSLFPHKDISQWSFLEQNFAVEKAIYTARKIDDERTRALRYDTILKTAGNEDVLAYHYADILREIVWIDSDNTLALNEVYTPILALSECYLLETDFFRNQRHSNAELIRFDARTDEILALYKPKNAEVVQRIYYTKLFILAEQNRWQDVKMLSEKIIELAPDSWIGQHIELVVEQLKFQRE